MFEVGRSSLMFCMLQPKMFSSVCLSHSYGLTPLSLHELKKEYIMTVRCFDPYEPSSFPKPTGEWCFDHEYFWAKQESGIQSRLSEVLNFALFPALVVVFGTADSLSISRRELWLEKIDDHRINRLFFKYRCRITEEEVRTKVKKEGCESCYALFFP